MNSLAEEYGLKDGKGKRGGRGVDRLPPHSPEAEVGVLGCVMLSPATCLDALEEAKFAPEWFYDVRHAAIFTECQKMREAKRQIDVITLQEALRVAGMLEQVGGISYLMELEDKVPSAGNLSYYVDIVREKWELRTMIEIGSDIVGRAYEAEKDVDSLKAEIEKDLAKLAEPSRQRPIVSLRQILLNTTVPELEANYHRGQAQINGYTTGFEYLDKVLGGFGGDSGNFIVLAGRPGTGKTTVATQVAVHLARTYAYWREITPENAITREQAGASVHRAEDGKCYERCTGVPVGIFSLEMSQRSLSRKILFQEAGADLQRWRTGFAKGEDLLLLAKGVERLGASSTHTILIDDEADGRIERIKSTARRWHREHGVRCFIIDYFQLLRGDRDARRKGSQVEEMEGVSKAILALSKELDCPFIVIAQMNRDWERDPHRTPQLSDLKGCGALEQDAHVVLFLYKPKLNEKNQEFYDETMEKVYGEKWRKWNGRPVRVNALVAKNREGETGPAELLFERSCVRFHDWGCWLKDRQLRAPAAGESGYGKQQLDTDEE